MIAPTSTKCGRMVQRKSFFPRSAKVNRPPLYVTFTITAHVSYVGIDRARRIQARLVKFSHKLDASFERYHRKFTLLRKSKRRSESS